MASSGWALPLKTIRFFSVVFFSPLTLNGSSVVLVSRVAPLIVTHRRSH